MAERNENVTKVVALRKLAEAIRDVKNAAADRDDVVVELREATRMRLQLLAAELAPVIADVPDSIDIFDFVISSGLQPRLWVDAVAHVAMGRDRRTFRFLKDTRVGRVVLAESADMAVVADQVTRYVAERIIERERLLDGHVDAAIAMPARQPVREAEPALVAPAAEHWATVRSGIWIALAGAGVGLVIALVLLRDRIAFFH